MREELAGTTGAGSSGAVWQFGPWHGNRMGASFIVASILASGATALPEKLPNVDVKAGLEAWTVQSPQVALATLVVNPAAPIAHEVKKNAIR
jgi:hypothetical protein